MTAAAIVDKVSFRPGRQLPVIMQSEGAECGLACLAMVAEYHGYRTNLIAMRQQFKLSLGGATLYDLMQFAAALNLTSRPLRLEPEALASLQTPCILHWDMNHFVVLKSAGARSVVIHDPARGERRMSLAEVSGHFTGVALELAPTKEFKEQKAKPTIRFSDFWSRISGLKKSILLVLCLSLALQAFVLAAPYYMQLVIDNVVLSADGALLNVLALGFGGLLLFEIATSSLRALTLLHFGSLLSAQLGANLFHHLVRLPMDYFEKRHMGDILSRFGSLQQIKNLLANSITEAIIDGMMAVATLVMILLYSTELAAVVMAATALYILIRLLTYRRLRDINEQAIIAKADESSNFMETVRGIQAIKLFGAEVKREGQWQNRYAEAINQNIRLGRFTIGYAAVNRFLFGLENIVVIYLAARLIMAGNFSVGMLFAFMAYKLQFIDKITHLIEKLIEFKMISLHMERLADIVLTEKEALASAHVLPHRTQGEISLENVSFRYSDTTPNVIDDLSLTIRAGESVAITGPSGCGKSTLAKIMLGLAVPQSGRVLIDGVPLEQVGPSQYRQQVAAVMQSDILLSGSIAENIGFFDDDIDLDRVQDCAKSAAIHQDIERMPMGYNTLIGDMGSTLSGGQKQRIILARALYRRPRILFMDEATSHLDTGVEAEINDAVRKLDMTRIIIAHRKETIASADREIALAGPRYA